MNKDIIDTLTLAISKAYIDTVAAGLTSVNVDGNIITFTTNGNDVVVTIPDLQESETSITGIEINSNKHLIFTMSDNTTIDAGELSLSENILNDLTFSVETDTSTVLTTPLNNNVLQSCLVTNTLTKSAENGTMNNPANFTTIQPTKVTLNNVDYEIGVSELYGFAENNVYDEFDIVSGKFISKIQKLVPENLSNNTIQYRNKSTTGNKYLAVRFKNAITDGDTLYDCNVATIAGLSGANQTEVQWSTWLSISFDYSIANTALVGTDYENVFTDENVSALSSSAFDGSYSGHTGIITGTSITRGTMFNAIIAYLTLCGAEWYVIRNTPIVSNYLSKVMPLLKGDNNISIDGGHVKCIYDVSCVGENRETVNLKEFGAIANDNTAGSTNYQSLLQAVQTSKKVIIDDTYYINVDSTSNACNSVKIDGVTQGKLYVTTSSGCISMFSIKSESTGIVDIQNLYIDVYSTENYNVPTLIGVEDSSNTALNMQYVLFNNLYFKKPYTLFDLSTSIDESTSLNFLTVTNCIFEQAHYQFYTANTFHTRSNVGVCYPVMRLYGMGYKHALIKDNYFHNCFFVLEDNDTTDWNNFQKEQLDFINNTLKNDDLYIPESAYICMYTGMVLTRCNYLRFINNVMEGLAVKLNGVANYANDTSTLFATYMATAYSRDVLFEGNSYKNNCNFSTNNQLIKCKITRTGYDDITSTKIYRSNSFVVESDWLKKTIEYATDYDNADSTELAKIISLGWSFASNYSITDYNSSNDVYDFCYSMSNLPVDYMAKSVVISDNYFRIEYLFDTTNECHSKSIILSNNVIESECIIGTFAKINKLPNYNTLITDEATSHNVYLCDFDKLDVINNSIVEIPVKYSSILTKCNRYSTSTNTTETNENSKLNEVFILVAGYCQQNDLSFNSVVIKNNVIYAHRFEFLFAYANELGHYYNVLKNIIISDNVAVADDVLLSFTPAITYLIYNNVSYAKTRKGIIAMYKKGNCDEPTSFLCSNNIVTDLRTGMEYTSNDVITALSDITTKTMINNYVNNTLVSLG